MFLVTGVPHNFTYDRCSKCYRWYVFYMLQVIGVLYFIGDWCSIMLQVNGVRYITGNRCSLCYR